MMTKLKLKFVIEVEYEPRPENYPENSRTPEGMLAVDLSNANDDPFMTIGDDSSNWVITGEILEGKEE